MAWLSPTATSTASGLVATLSVPHPFFFSHLRRSNMSHILHTTNFPIATDELNTTVQASRRNLAFLLIFPASMTLSPSLAAAPLIALDRYTDEAEGFTLLKPTSWAKMEKAGATALFEEGVGSNSIGVVVNPVRLSSLKEFGTPQFVSEKLIQAERRKESTKHAELLNVSERLGHGGMPVYEFEYSLDSTRGGMKRIFSAAFVASKKLYLLNITYSNQPENPLDGETEAVLQHILHSFDTV